MTEKQFAKLKRHELLQLLLAQGQEAKQREERMAGLEAQAEELERSCARLKERLDEKDAQIGRLKDRLNGKDERIRSLEETLEEERMSRRIQLEEAGSIAEAAMRLNGVFEAAQKAADQYLDNIRLLVREPEKRQGEVRIPAREETAEGTETLSREETVEEMEVPEQEETAEGTEAQEGLEGDIHEVVKAGDIR